MAIFTHVKISKTPQLYLVPHLMFYFFNPAMEISHTVLLSSRLQ